MSDINQNTELMISIVHRFNETVESFIEKFNINSVELRQFSSELSRVSNKIIHLSNEINSVKIQLQQQSMTLEEMKHYIDSLDTRYNKNNLSIKSITKEIETYKEQVNSNFDIIQKAIEEKIIQQSDKSSEYKNNKYCQCCCIS